MAFSDKLKLYRQRANLTQEELATKLNISQKTISSWEIGRSDPTMKQIYTLCNILDCPLEDLTDTRRRKIGEITKEDIYIKLNDLSISELNELKNAVEVKIYEREKYAMIEAEKHDLEKQIEAMQKRLLAYEDKMNEYKKTSLR